ncbi:MAG: hypothetical protein ABSG92_04720 [Conexivisphaerales archaeon]
MTKKELAKELAALKTEIASLKTELALKTEVASLKTELAHLRTEQRVKLKDEIDNLHKKMQAELEALKAAAGAKREEKKIKGKVQALEEKAAKATGKAKAAIEARMKNTPNESKKVATSVEEPKEVKPGN